MLALGIILAMLGLPTLPSASAQDCAGMHHLICDADGPQFYDYFGVPDISGSWAIFGKSGHNDEECSQGCVYIYEKGSGKWKEHALLVHPFPTTPGDPEDDDPSEGEFLGESVAIDGHRAIAGAHGWDDSRGRISIFSYKHLATPPGWSYDFVDLTLPNALPGDRLGGGAQWRKAIDINGNTIAGGAPYWNAPGAVSDAGRVGIWEWNGTSWSALPQILTASSFAGATSQEDGEFGASVAIDGDWMVISEPYRTIGTAGFAGRIYIAKRGSTSWTAETFIDPPTETEGGNFGYSVAIEGDVIIVGEPGQPGGSDVGRVHLYRLDENEQWQPYANTPIEHPDAENGIIFGRAVAISGPLFLVGDPLYFGPGSVQGAGFLFQRDVSGQWVHVRTLVPEFDDGTNYYGGFFGAALALSGSDAIIYPDRLSYNGPGGVDINGNGYINIGSATFYRGLPGCTVYEPNCAGLPGPVCPCPQSCP